jgi:hypothetical protein
MLKKLLILLFINTSIFGQIDIDNNVSIKFPNQIKKSDTIFTNIKVTSFEYNNELDFYLLSRVSVVNNKNNEKNVLPKNLNELTKIYKSNIESLVKRMEKKTFILSETIEINIENFVAYKLIFKNSITDLKNAESIILNLNGINYIVVYSEIHEFDEKRKTDFLNSFKIKNPESQKQLKTPKNYIYDFLKIILRIGIIAGIFYLLMKVRKNYR